MSFDVFLQGFGEAKQIGMPREHVRRLFPIVESESEPDRWVVQYDELNRSEIFVKGEQEPLDSLMVNRPSGDIRLWDALLTIMRLGSFVMFWPGSPLLVARGCTYGPLPDGMIEDFGEPVVIDRAEEFFDLLKST